MPLNNNATELRDGIYRTSETVENIAILLFFYHVFYLLIFSYVILHHSTRSKKHNAPGVETQKQGLVYTVAQPNLPIIFITGFFRLMEATMGVQTLI